MTYGNGDSVSYEYDEEGRVTKETFEDGTTVSYQYDNTGALATVTDSETGISTTYYYDLTNRMVQYVESGTGYSHSVGYEYDVKNRLTQLVETINGTSHTSSYTYDSDNRVLTSTRDSVTTTYAYDDYGRLSGKTFGIFGYDYSYRNSTTGNPTGQLQSLSFRKNGTNIVRSASYTYDDNGNILSVNDGVWIIYYTYDSANQLISENNPWEGYFWEWTYDDAGNILSRKKYARTYGEKGELLDTVNYAYNNSNWDDLLTAYDMRLFSYDAIGNLTDDGIWEYTWKHGRELASMTDGSTTWTYTYDANGMRTKRTNGTTTYEYVYNGGQLSQMTVGNNVLNFIYDASGIPVAVTLNGVMYYYSVNAQGDVTGIFTATGTDICRYVYDAWGRIVYQYSTSGYTIATLNPLRYRGYVYDSETELYYLQSRYYNPEVGRFLNADAFIATGQGMTGNNMFIYCGNNPVRNIDSGGHAWHTFEDRFGGINSYSGGIVDSGGGGGGVSGWKPEGWSPPPSIPADYKFHVEFGVPTSHHRGRLFHEKILAGSISALKLDIDEIVLLEGNITAIGGTWQWENFHLGLDWFNANASAAIGKKGFALGARGSLIDISGTFLFGNSKLGVTLHYASVGAEVGIDLDDDCASLTVSPGFLGLTITWERQR